MKKVFCWIFIFISFVLSITSIVLHFFPFSSKPTANKIYNDCICNVVEVKAKSENVGESFGTGEIISADGKIVTNSHVVTYTRLSVINEFEKYYIRFVFEDDYRTATLERYDSNSDIAILQLTDYSDITLKTIKMGNSDELKSGDKIYAVGNASNYGVGIFEGIVSIPLITVELDGLTRNVIQCDLTIAAGNSGGALINEKGEMVGITTFRTKDMSGNVIYGIVYCIPINTVLDYI